MRLIVTTPEGTVQFDDVAPATMDQSLAALRRLAVEDDLALREFTDGRIQVVWPNGRYLIARPVRR